jgi:molecular chaperone DnaK
LLDVIPLTLGIETLGNVATKLIEANTTIPTKKSEIFSTAADNQTSVEIHVLQGDRAMAKDNRTLGKFILDGIPPSPRGIPQIEVTFDVDANGILNVSAKDKATNKEQSIRIEASSGLSEEEVEKMRKDAQSHAAEDSKLKEEVDTRNQADSIVYQTEKQMKEMDDKLSADDKSKIETSLGRLKESLKSNNVDEMKSAIDQVNKDWNEIATKIYSQTGAAPGAGQQEPPQGEPASGGGDGKSNGEVQDADYEVVDDDKKN